MNREQFEALMDFLKSGERDRTVEDVVGYIDKAFEAVTYETQSDRKTTTKYWWLENRFYFVLDKRDWGDGDDVYFALGHASWWYKLELAVGGVLSDPCILSEMEELELRQDVEATLEQDLTPTKPQTLKELKNHPSMFVTLPKALQKDEEVVQAMCDSLAAELCENIEDEEEFFEALGMPAYVSRFEERAVGLGLERSPFECDVKTLALSSLNKRFDGVLKNFVSEHEAMQNALYSPLPEDDQMEKYQVLHMELQQALTGFKSGLFHMGRHIKMLEDLSADWPCDRAGQSTLPREPGKNAFLENYPEAVGWTALLQETANEMAQGLERVVKYSEQCQYLHPLYDECATVEEIKAYRDKLTAEVAANEELYLFAKAVIPWHREINRPQGPAAPCR